MSTEPPPGTGDSVLASFLKSPDAHVLFASRKDWRAIRNWLYLPSNCSVFTSKSSLSFGGVSQITTLTSTSLLVSRTPNLAFPRLPQIFELCRGDLAAQPATLRIECPRFAPVPVWHSLHQSQTSSCGHTVANKAYGAWFQVRMVSDDSSLQVGVFAVGCGLCIQKECYASLIHESEMVLQLERNSCHFLSSLSNGTGFAANLNISDTPVFHTRI